MEIQKYKFNNEKIYLGDEPKLSLEISKNYKNMTEAEKESALEDLFNSERRFMMATNICTKLIDTLSTEEQRTNPFVIKSCYEVLGDSILQYIKDPDILNDLVSSKEENEENKEDVNM